MTRCRLIRAPVKTGCLLFLALGAIAAHCQAYLPRVGPVPLRFAESPRVKNYALVLTIPAMSTAAETNATVVETISLPATNSLATNSVVAISSGVTNEPSADIFSVSSGTPQPSPTSYLPAETTPVSGEILAELFKPVGGKRGQSGVSLTLPIDAGFAPPQPKNTQSSTAVYKSE